jgi:HK97 family phage portal protein
VSYGARVLSGAVVADEAAEAVFSKGMRASGFLKSKDILKESQRTQLKEALTKFRGDNDPGGVMTLEADMTYQALAMNPVDSQLLETRAWSVEEICRWFRVPPFMVGHSEKSTSWGTGIEQQMIGFVTFVLRPWCVRLEQGINSSLLADNESGRYFAEFALEGLLRGDSASRSAFYGILIDKGILTRDEVRALENWPAMGGNAAVLTVQSATVPLDGISAATDASKAQDALKAWLTDEVKA